MTAPAYYRWTGDAMVPLRPKETAAHFTVGDVVCLEPIEPRSSAYHRMYFACVNEAWANLPESIAHQYPSPDHLRRYALVHTGFRDERVFVCANDSEARKMAVFIRPLDGFAVISVSGSAVVVCTAKSQSLKAMKRDEFRHSAEAVLAYLAKMIGVSVEQLGRAA